MDSNALLNVRVALTVALLLVGITLAFPPRKGDVIEVNLQTANGNVIGNTIVLAPFWAPDKGLVWDSLLPSPTGFAAAWAIFVERKEIAVGFWIKWELTLILISAALTGWVARQKRVEIKVSIVVAAILIFLSLLLAPKTKHHLVEPLSKGMSEPYFTVGPVWQDWSHFDALVVEWCLIVVIATLVGLRTATNVPLAPLRSSTDVSLAKRAIRKANSLPVASAKQTPDSSIRAIIKERVANLGDEEILKMVTIYSPGYGKEWIDISIEELKERGFVLEVTDAELKVVKPDGQKLVYPKVKSDVGPIRDSARS